MNTKTIAWIAAAGLVFAGGYLTRLLFEITSYAGGSPPPGGGAADSKGMTSPRGAAHDHTRTNNSEKSPALLPDGRGVFASGGGAQWLRLWPGRVSLDNEEMDAADMVHTIDRMSTEEIAELAGELERGIPRRDQETESKEAPSNSDSDANSVASLAPHHLHRLLYLVWAERAPKSALAHLMAVKGEDDRRMSYEQIFEDLHAVWAQCDPAGVAASVTEVAHQFRELAENLPLGNITADLARQHPSEALQMVRNFPKNNRREDSYAALLRTVAADDPAKAAQMGVELAAGKQGTQPMMSAMYYWMSKDPAAAEAWALSYDGPGRSDVMMAILGPKMEKGDFRSISTEFGKVAGLEDTEAVHHLAKRFVEKYRDDSGGIAAAREWIDSLPQGSAARSVASHELAKQWVEKDLSAASEWIATLPKNPARDSCVAALVDAIADNDPADALTWAKSMTEGSESRHVEIYLSLISLKRKDEAAYQAALKALSPADRKGVDTAHQKMIASDPFAAPAEPGKE